MQKKKAAHAADFVFKNNLEISSKARFKQENTASLSREFSILSTR